MVRAKRKPAGCHFYLASILGLCGVVSIYNGQSAVLHVARVLMTTNSAAPSIVPQVSLMTRNLIQKRESPGESTASMSNAIDIIDSSAWPGRLDHIADSLNRIVVLIVSCPYLDMADNAIHSMIRLHANNFVVVPLDDVAYDVLMQLYPRNVVRPMPTIQKLNVSDQAASYNSDHFQLLTSTRPAILSAFLKQNYTVFYCDIDTVWRSNTLLDMLEASTQTTEQHHHLLQQNQQPSHELVLTMDSAILSEEKFCSCYIYAKPTLNNLYMLDRWTNEIATNRYRNDQDAFQSVVQATRRRMGVRILSGDDSHIPNGWFYFQVFNETQREGVSIVHNNFILGHERKRTRFRQLKLWRPSGRLEAISHSCSSKS